MNTLNIPLKKLGFSPEESKIYLACLEFGTLPVSTISRLSGIGRINCYHYIEKLLEKEFLVPEKRKGMKYFSAENPKILRNKQQERINIAEEILPEMLALSAKTPQKPKIQFFEGIKGVEKIFQKMEEISNSEIVSFSHFESLENMPEKFLKQHFEARKNKKIKTRFITPQTENSQKFQNKFLWNLSEKNLLEIFFISPQEFNFASEISIFSGNIAIFSMSENNAQGVLIENPELYQTQKAIFDLAWLGATSFIAG